MNEKIEKPDPFFCIKRLGEKLDECSRTHQGICDRPRHTILPTTDGLSNPILEPRGLRVLDVETLEIVGAPTNCRYVGLSYVWERGNRGESGQSLDGSNLGFVPSRDNISKWPKTIADAVTICLAIGEKYLWVDAFCIMQSDPSDVSHQIAQMGLIYSYAVATIIAATQSDPSAGIPNVRQTTGEPEPQVSLQNVLSNSLWGSRGWTYQELVLSRRLLIFTSRGSFFHCAVQKHDLPQWGLPSYEHKTSWELYNQVLGYYTQRSLSQKSDTVNALSGVLRAFARYTDDSIFGGLPARQLFYAMLWHPVSAAERQVDWPSWSWAGWTGAGQKLCHVNNPAYYAVPSQEAVHRGRRLFPCFGALSFRAENGDEFPIDLRPSSQSLNSWLSVKRLYDRPAPLPTLLPDKEHHAKGWLTFKTTLLTLSIVPEVDYTTVSQDAPMLKRHRLLWGDVWVGTIFLNPDAEGKYPDVSEPGEFITIAKFNCPIHEIGKHHMRGLLDASESNRPAIFPDEHYQRAEDVQNQEFEEWRGGGFHCRSGWRYEYTGYSNLTFDEEADEHFGMPYPASVTCLYVMWVDRKDDIIYRKAIGVVIDKHWKGVAPEKECCLG